MTARGGAVDAQPAPSSSSARVSGGETAPPKVRGPRPLTTIAGRLDRISEALLGENREILHHGAEIALLRDLYVHYAQ